MKGANGETTVDKLSSAHSAGRMTGAVKEDIE